MNFPCLKLISYAIVDDDVDDEGCGDPVEFEWADDFTSTPR